LDALKKRQRVPKSLFVHGDSSVNIRNTDGIFEEKGKEVVRAVFGSVPNNETYGSAVREAYAIGQEGFDLCSIQFAIHYMFESSRKLHEFLRNVSETTKLGGYFIGTSYDGSKIFKLLSGKREGESESINDEETGDKIWQVTKRYNSKKFDADSSSIGYAIDVYQETINKEFREYLVNYEYLAELLQHYGFDRDTSKITKSRFSDIYKDYVEEVGKQVKNKTNYKKSGKSLMNENEEKISFFNRLFVFKKNRNVDAKNISERLVVSEYSDDNSDDDTKNNEGNVKAIAGEEEEKEEEEEEKEEEEEEKEEERRR